MTNGMIKETHRKIAFIPYLSRKRTREDDSAVKPLTAGVSVKFASINMPRRTCGTLGMTGKLVKFFFEPTRKIVGWRIYPQSVSLESLKEYKLCKPNPDSGTWQVSIKGILNEMKGLNPDGNKKLVVHKYIEQDMLSKGDAYYYVQLKLSDDE